jgi:hypothetical protein
MKQLLLASFLVTAPVGLFAVFEHYTAPATQTAASLGDLSALIAIVSKVETIAATGDLPAAKTAIKEFETTWDDGEPTLRPLNPATWGAIDDAADVALKALRKETPVAADVTATLANLAATLDNPINTAVATGVQLVNGVAVTDATGHALPCEEMLKSVATALAAKPNAAASDLQAKALERCNADDDTHADAFSAQALALVSP